MVGYLALRIDQCRIVLVLVGAAIVFLILSSKQNNSSSNKVVMQEVLNQKSVGINMNSNLVLNLILLHSMMKY